MATELSIYRAEYTVDRRGPDGKMHRARPEHEWTVGANAEEAIAKRRAHVERFDRPPEGWATDGIEVTAVEQVGTLRRCAECREFRADEHRILCLCNGLRCRRCGRLKMHRPTSSYYNERDGRLWHIPWFYAPTLCGDCDPLDRVNARAWAAAVSAEPGVRPDETYHASEASVGPKLKSRRTLVARYGGVFSEPLDALLQFQGASGASTARTFAATFSEDDDRDAYVLFVAISTRATVLCEVGQLEYLVPAVLTTEQRTALLARGFVISKSGQAGRREIVVEDAEWAQREAAAALEVLFDVFGYRGGRLLKTGWTI